MTACNNTQHARMRLAQLNCLSSIVIRTPRQN